ncbi:hypothetical protein J2R87_004548 [Bradyrhizobium elkanii]|nr:hypothetical protein [Bradyrhizobium elkanii]MCS4107685.1 hypothetical protein [Bradyrhizobium elkanii]
MKRPGSPPTGNRVTANDAVVTVTCDPDWGHTRARSHFPRRNSINHGHLAEIECVTDGVACFLSIDAIVDEGSFNANIVIRERR